MTRKPPPGADWNDTACTVTEAALLVALESGAGERVTSHQAHGILIGLLRAAARWAVMVYPPALDGGFEQAFRKCLQQARANQRPDTANEP